MSQKFTIDKITPTDVKWATAICFLAWVFAVYDFILFGTLLPEIQKEYGWTDAGTAQIMTWISVGTAIVCLGVGPFIDRFGRKAGIIWTVVGAAIVSGLTVVGGSMGAFVLIFIRSWAGLGYAEQTVNATYLNEMYDSANDERLNKHKGFIYSLVQGGWPVGALLAAGLTALLLPYLGWKGSFIFAMLPSIIIVLLASKLKESPVFILQKRLQAMQKSGQVSEATAFAAEHNLNMEESKHVGFSALFKGSTTRATIVLCLGFFLNWFAIQVFSVLSSTVLTKVHNISFDNSMLIIIVSNLIGYFGYLTHGWIGDRLGRRNTIGFGWMVGGLSFATMLYGPSDALIVVSLYSVGLFFLIGPYAAALLFVSESFPANIRGSAGALVNAMGPIGAIVAGIGSTFMLSANQTWLEAAFWFGAMPCFLSGCLIFLARNVSNK